MQTAISVDLKRYAGSWYEIARSDNRFEKSCVSNVSAHYKLRDDGIIEIVNSCRRLDGKLEAWRSIARVQDTSTNARWEVGSFWPFSRDYWIVDVDPEYRYAIVGGPRGKYWRILSRTRSLDEEVYQHLLRKAQSLGYDTSHMVRTPQTDLSGRQSPGPTLLR
jgi:apolipoprotein D and lipocalin family protein